MIEEPAPPFIELNVYEGRRPAAELLQAVLDVLARRGARPVRALVHPGVDPSAPFAGPTDVAGEYVALASLVDVAAQTAEQGRLVEVGVAGAFAYDRGRLARVTIGQVDDDLVGIDRNPVAIWASGEPLGGTSRGLGAAGREVREVFEAVVEGVRPEYGAITEEWPLVTPRTMAREAATDGDYKDVYLGLPRGHPVRAEVLGAAQGTTVVEDEEGVFVYSSVDLGGTGAPAEEVAVAFASAVRQVWAQ